MNTLFPFGFSGPTQFYLGLYVLTLVVHVGFMHYVLAGTAVLAAGAVRSSRPMGADTSKPGACLREILRDWMPFALSAAITAGVAPLLFVQILYKTNFYTANLLLFHRWMAVVPVLIVGFYMLYLIKASVAGNGVSIPPAGDRRASGRQILAAIIALACFVFTAWSWTENHLLSLDSAHWPAMYGANQWSYRNAALFPRLALWFVGAFPSLCIILGWQVISMAKWNDAQRLDAMSRLSRRAILAVALTLLASIGWFLSLNSAARDALKGSLAGPYAALAAAGLVLQATGWHRQRSRCTRRGSVCRSSLWLASVGLVLTLIGGAVCREAVRISAIDITQLYDRHRAASQVGGLAVFAAFMIINIGLIAWCFRLVRRGRKAQ